MLQDAAELAGLGLARMLPEPTAAAFAFGMLQTLDPTKDWGSMTGCPYVWCRLRTPTLAYGWMMGDEGWWKIGRAHV